MKTFRTTSGPFTERPYYALDEIENICIDELQKVGLFPSSPEPIRVERFIEKKFKISVTYDKLPEDILGFIEFGPDGVRGITVSKVLAEEGSKVAERRINTTLAHEAGHGLLHAHLFVFEQNLETLFRTDIDSSKPKILCRKDTIQGIQGYIDTGYRWWEYQANLVIGPLLLPRTLVMKSLEPFLIENGTLELRVLNRSRQEEAIRVLSQVFDVNPIVAKIRLETLFPFGRDQQLTL